MPARVTSVRQQLWLLAHDENYEMRPRIDTRALDIGLAAAVLVDLMLSDRIRVDGGLIFWNRENRDAVGDPIAANVARAIAVGPAPRLAEVLREARVELLGGEHSPFQGLYAHTRAVLIADGYLIEQRRRLFGSRYSLTEQHKSVTFSLLGKISHRLARYPAVDDDLAFDCLLALVWALELHSKLPMVYSTSEAEPVLSHMTEQIPWRAGEGSPLTVVPHLAKLVRHAVGELATAQF